MIESIIKASIKKRVLVMAGVLLMAGAGLWNFQKLPIDAVPDITNVQVQINTEAPGYSPLESEQRITYPVETALAGIPNLSYTRSLSRYGLSQVTRERRARGAAGLHLLSGAIFRHGKWSGKRVVFRHRKASNRFKEKWRG